MKVVPWRDLQIVFQVMSGSGSGQNQWADSVLSFCLFGKTPSVGAVTGTEKSRASVQSSESFIFFLYMCSYCDAELETLAKISEILEWFKLRVGQSSFSDCYLFNLDVQILCNMLEPCSTKLFLVFSPLLALLLLFFFCLHCIIAVFRFCFFVPNSALLLHGLGISELLHHRKKELFVLGSPQTFEGRVQLNKPNIITA